MQNSSSGRKVTLVNKATRNWRIAFQISKFYVEPQYSRDIRNRGMKINRETLVGPEKYEEHCPNCGKITMFPFGGYVETSSYIRCDIQGQAESAFFCTKNCIIEYSGKHPNVRITMEADDY